MSSWFSNVVLAGVVLAAAAAPAAAQMPPQPYAGMQTRAIKALSDEERADLMAGRGMGLALPAELNGYPGPAHVLDLADRLGLTEEQHTKIKQLFDSMKSEAVPVGKKLIAAEADLDHRLAARTITPEQLKTEIETIAEIRGELRYAHLKYHIATADLLTQDQIRRYAELRGYAGAGVASGADSGPSPMMGHHGAAGAAMHAHGMAPLPAE